MTKVIIKTIHRPGYTLQVIQGENGINSKDDNVDVELTLDSGERYVATFFTLQNIRSLFQKNKITGECSAGTYLWASDMILVERLTEEVLLRSIEDLRSNGELTAAFSRIID